MQIILVQNEIEQALQDYIAARMKIMAGNSIEVELRATRGVDGATAVIDIVEDSKTQEAVQTPSRAPLSEPKKEPEPDLNTDEVSDSFPEEEIKEVPRKLFEHLKPNEKD